MPIVVFGNLSLGVEEIAVTDAAARLISERLHAIGGPDHEAAAETLEHAIAGNSTCRPPDNELTAIEEAIDDAEQTLKSLRKSIIKRREALADHA